MHDDVPDRVREFAEQAVAYIRAAFDIEVTYDSDTLPIVDHYLRSVPIDQIATVSLVAATAGAYFGEVVRRALGGEWDLESDDPVAWRVIMPSEISITPAGVVAAVIARTDDLDDMDAGIDAPPGVRPQLEAVLSRMGEVTEEEYFSLCGRFDTLEHVQEVLLAMRLIRQAPPN